MGARSRANPDAADGLLHDDSEDEAVVDERLACYELNGVVQLLDLLLGVISWQAEVGAATANVATIVVPHGFEGDPAVSGRVVVPGSRVAVVGVLAVCFAVLDVGIVTVASAIRESETVDDL